MTLMHAETIKIQHLMFRFIIQNERDRQRACLVTVTVSEHNAGVLSSQLQSHSLQVTFGCCFFDQLAYLHTQWYTTIRSYTLMYYGYMKLSGFKIF